MQVISLLFFTFITLNANAWKSEYQAYLKKCDKKTFSTFHKKFSNQVFSNRKRSDIEDTLTHLYFSSHMSPADEDYVHFTACGAHFSAFYYMLDSLKNTEESVFKEWERCLKNSFNGKMPKDYKTNIACAKKSFLK